MTTTTKELFVKWQDEVEDTDRQFCDGIYDKIREGASLPDVMVKVQEYVEVMTEKAYTRGSKDVAVILNDLLVELEINATERDESVIEEPTSTVKTPIMLALIPFSIVSSDNMVVDVKYFHTVQDVLSYLQANIVSVPTFSFYGGNVATMGSPGINVRDDTGMIVARISSTDDATHVTDEIVNYFLNL